MIRQINKIILLGSYPPLRAISSYCYELSQSLAERVRIDFFSFHHLYPKRLYPGGSLQEDFSFPESQKEGLSVYRFLNWYNPFTWLRASLLCRAQLLHVQWWSFPLVFTYLCICAGFKIRGIPVVITVHNVLAHEKSNVWKLLSRMLFRFGDHFIVHSKENQQQLRSFFGLPLAKISIIPHGILEFQVRPAIVREKLRRDLGFALDDRVILLFGAIRPYKGIDTAIRAFARAASEIHSLQLLVAGKAWGDWQPYADLIREYNLNDKVKVHLEYIPAEEVYRFFEAADLVLLPYHHFDSQSGVGATALAFRKPMIVSDTGGLKDFVPASRALKPGDSAALARAIIQFFSDPAENTQILRHMDRIIDDYSWPSIVDKTLKVYQKVLMHSNRP